MWIDVKVNSNYQISNVLVIRNKKTGKVLTPFLKSSGYFVIGLGAKQYQFHRIVAEAFVENKQHKPYVNHINGNKQDNSPTNLEWVTNQENINHGWALNLYKKKYLLNGCNIISIHSNHGSMTISEMSRLFGFSRKTIKKVLTNTYFT